jgi:predicted lipoprotein with Yx(FWY)xxD motif
MRAIAILAAVAAVLALSGTADASDRSVLTTGKSSYGRVLFDGRGFALYAFTHDTKGKSTCAGACAKAWPPYLVKNAAKAGAGTRARLLGTTRRGDGSLQVTYKGQPLYYYVGDRSAGQILCQNVTEFGGVWLVVRPDGGLVR